MKKILALLAAMALSCSMLVSCGDEDSSSKGDDSSTASVADTSSAADDTSSEADASSEEDSSEADSSEDDTSSEADKPASGGSLAEKLPVTAKIENITEKETDERLFEKLVNDITTNKTCTMDYELSEDGMSMMAIITMDADNVYMDMDLGIMKITALINPDGSYYIDKEAKKYYKEAGEDASTEELGMSLVEEMTGLEGMEYVSTADCEVDGKAYVLETWKNTEDMGTEMQYVFDGDDIVLIINADGGQMPFLLSAKADTSLFTLDGMTEMTEEEYQAYQETLMGGMSGATGTDAE